MTVTINGTGPIVGSDRAGSGTNSDITNLSNISSINSGQLGGFRNRIINGGMQIGQRVDATFSGAYQFGKCDRWQFSCAGGTSISGTVTQIYFISFSSGYSGGVINASWTNGQFFAKQLIEAKNVADFGSKTVTVSAKVYQDTGAARSFYFTLIRATGGVDNWGSQVSIGTSSALPVPTTTVTQLSAQFTLGASDNINGLGILIYDTATNTVVNKSYQVGDVQIELGNVATNFEQRSNGFELVLCQRYFSKYSNVFCQGYNTAGGSVYIAQPLPTPMRSVPSFVIGTTSYVNASALGVNLVTQDIVRLGATITATGFGYGSVDGTITFNAELT